MAVRPIDGNELYRIEKLLDTDIVRQDKVALNLLEQVLYDIQHVPTLIPPNEWVSVEERLPEEKQRVIVRCERVGTSVGWILWGRWMTDIGPHAGDVTHWMPLPAPPDKDNHVPAKAPNEPLPCKIDDDVYINLFGRTLDATVISISELASTPTYKAMYGIRLCYIFKADDVGRTVFLTREAAEEALKEREQE